MKTKESKSTIVFAVLGGALFLWLGISYTINTLMQGESRVCTVTSAEHIQDYNAGAPTASVEVETSDCGKIIITKMKYPDGVNMAKLAEVLNAHQGEKFEFILKYIQFDADRPGAYGVSSLEPVQ
ncbi:hypothetical protein [Rothia terrae]|uniref:Uncharacterized protein n=1 Tax=Rothia terrae TaxID=396015 RepID=A0A7S7AZV9_9MICC|nr:hypothetical protein [Rothia terrae]QOW64692.1 hypothetical protein IDM49_11355 [Rothia terrae]